jgi:hypothetical protein
VVISTLEFVSSLSKVNQDMELIQILTDTRILLTLLMDENARPSKKDMKLWVDVVRFVKQGARGGALGFFTYMGKTFKCLSCYNIILNYISSDRTHNMAFAFPPLPSGQIEVVSIPQ